MRAPERWLGGAAAGLVATALVVSPGCGSSSENEPGGNNGGSVSTGGTSTTGGGGSGGGSACVPEDEVCDGFDNDCDDVVDEDCPCIEGDTQDC